jgi:hypothetical protein
MKSSWFGHEIPGCLSRHPSRQSHPEGGIFHGTPTLRSTVWSPQFQRLVSNSNIWVIWSRKSPRQRRDTERSERG